VDLDLDAGGHTLALHSGNYYKIAFSVLHVMPKPEFDPCKDLEGVRARVEYVTATGKATAGGIVSIELLK
jgi:hypothetical protein